jgi:glyceraldehyde-3-phosphate dehydrogenase type II
MKVLVNGVGNIGQTLLGVLQQFKELLGITEVYALKNNVQPWGKPELDMLVAQGIKVFVPAKSNMSQDYPNIHEVIHEVDYIFDCTANGIALKNKSWYASLSNLKGCVAQGSEKGFGIPFMSGVDDALIPFEKFVQVVSCNTHGLASVLKTFSNNQLGRVSEADFVVVRRSEDIGNHSKLVSANVVSRHLSSAIGTHHAIDVQDLYQTIGQTLVLTSSDVTTPSQLMHAVRFNIQFNTPFDGCIDALIAQQSLVSQTQKFDSNVVFELGRRYGVMGRIYAHAIIVSNNLLVSDRGVEGWAFIPQEGNSILSTIHAYLLRFYPEVASEKISTLIDILVKKYW